MLEMRTHTHRCTTHLLLLERSRAGDPYLDHTLRPWDSELRTSRGYIKSLPPLRKQARTLSYQAFHLRAEQSRAEQRQRRRRRRGITVKRHRSWRSVDKRREERRSKRLEEVKQCPKLVFCCIFWLSNCLLASCVFLQERFACMLHRLTPLTDKQDFTTLSDFSLRVRFDRYTPAL